MKKSVHIAIFCLIFLGCLKPSYSRTDGIQCLSPIQFGLLDAKNDLERYQVLLKCHKEAVKQQKGVNYKGIGTIVVELPIHDFELIPLSHYTDFAGIELKCVYHGAKNRSLFAMLQEGKPLAVNAIDVDNANFKIVSELNNGLYLLSIKDEMPWIVERIGYGYSHYRKDIILVKGGKGTTKPIQPYNNEFSKVSAKFISVSAIEKVFKNLRFVRDESNTAIVKLISASMQYNLHISNISVFTPQDNNLYGDGIFTISNSVKVIFDNVNVDGTYSRADKYGYAFDLNNVCEFSAKQLSAFGRWGVFGTNNLKNVHLEDCDINRFDIHCYGYCVKCKNCRFSQLYNQFSCTYGTISFVGCTFDKVTPYLNGSSYNTYVPVDIKFKKCTFIINEKKNSIIRVTGLSDVVNPREELSKKNLPNVEMSNCKVFLDSNVKEWQLMDVGSFELTNLLDGIKRIYIKNLNVIGRDVDFKFTNKEIITKQKFKIEVKKSNEFNAFLNLVL